MDRREFLDKTARAALAAPLLAQSVRAGEAAGGARSRRIPKAVKFGMVEGDASVTEKFRLLARLGFDGVEMDSPSQLDEDTILRARDATGFTIHGVVDSVHWRRPFSDPSPEVRAEGRRALEIAIRQSARFGGTSVLVVPAVVNAEVSYDAAWERSMAEIRRVLPLAAEKKIRILFENVWNHFLLSPLEAARWVDEFESPWVGWYLDVGNVVNFGWPEQWIRILGARIGKIDVKGFSRKKRDAEGLWKGFAVKIGDGDCGWPAVRTALDEIGYDGWATAEVSGGGAKRLADVAARMDRVLGRA